MRARELMSKNPACCTPDDTVQRAARLMVDCDCGCIPVVEDSESNRLVGVITDRDIAIRAIGHGRGADTKVRDVMTTDVRTAQPDDEVDAVEIIMIREQVRRVPVVDPDGRCVGIIAQADLAVKHGAATDSEVGRVVERISEPAS